MRELTFESQHIESIALTEIKQSGAQLRFILNQRKKPSKKIDLYKEFEKFCINLLNATVLYIYHVRLQEIAMFNYPRAILRQAEATIYRKTGSSVNVSACGPKTVIPGT